MHRVRRRSDLVRSSVVGVGLVALVPAAWWFSLFVEGDEGGSDYIVKPPASLDDSKHIIGLTSIVVATVALVVFVHALRKRLIRTQWIGIVLPLSFLAVYVGFTARVVSAPASGANIGGGLLLLMAGPLSLGLVAWTIKSAIRLHRTDPSLDARTTSACRSTPPG